MLDLKKCPICGAESKPIRKLKADFIVGQLESYYAETPPDNLDISDYEIRKCKNCSLEYAWPLQAGSESFYRWVTNHPSYYPDSRWEWFTVLECLQKTNLVPTDILEIGCGSGQFLNLVKQIPNFRVVGLDTTITSVERCRSQDLEVYCETIECFLQNPYYENRRFDFVIAFHCLEHVSNPKAFVTSMLSVLKPMGSIFLSTPYSPMSFENVWFDPLNHPPHHITRWNASSYNELARQLNLKIKLFMPSASSLIDRTLYALNLSWNSPARLASRRSMVFATLQHPLITFKEWMRQHKREKVNNQIAADVVLVELTRE